MIQTGFKWNLEVARLANDLLVKYKLNDWRFRYDKAKCRAGCCKYRSKTITLSVNYVRSNLDKIEHIKDTILHEIAHALTPGASHGWQWKLKCREIGANPTRCYDGAKVSMPKGRWQATCPTCSKVYYRHRKPKYLGNTHGAFYFCPKCGRDSKLLFKKEG
jgi:predicted SprT family Zn-dependent metalloprotease